MLEISKEFTHYDEESGLTLQDGAHEGYLTEKIAEKVYNQLYKQIDEEKLDELANEYNPLRLNGGNSYISHYIMEAFKAGYCKAKEE